MDCALLYKNYPTLCHSVLLSSGSPEAINLSAQHQRQRQQDEKRSVTNFKPYLTFLCVPKEANQVAAAAAGSCQCCPQPLQLTAAACLHLAWPALSITTCYADATSCR